MRLRQSLAPSFTEKTLNNGSSKKSADMDQGLFNNWKQFGVCNGSISTLKPVLSGIIQGSVLGPSLFLCFINDLRLVIRYCALFLFADDAKLLNKDYSVADHEQIQFDLNTIAN